MTVDVLFIQGAGESTHDSWDNKLVASLERELGPNYRVRYPRMPDEADPKYATWKNALVDELASLGDGAILVGHSVGGTILLHVLAEDPPAWTPGALVLLAAPFIGDGGWPSEDMQARTHFALPDAPVFLFHGAADDSVPVSHAQLYAKAIPHATIRVLDGCDHQLNNDLAEVARAIRSPQ
jgi:predicted alpha/beta hydrolase family esterase